jgi:hypothetical protein
MYDRTTSVEKVNELRKEIFSKKTPAMKNIPPTQEALLQHANKAVYQASIWVSSLNSTQSAPMPNGFGWTRVENKWPPLWTLMPEAAEAFTDLMKCGCKTETLCSRRCKYKNAHLLSTMMCGCNAACE